MLSANDKWDVMLKKAKAQQQEYYELMPQWTRYEKEQYKYLKQNIGFALFGPPLELTEELEVSDIHDVTHVVNYPSQARKIIDTVYEKICTFGKMYENIGTPNTPIKKEFILFQTIYNVTFCTKKALVKGTDMNLSPNPVFKISTQSKPSKVLYIDMEGRVYQKWMDYLTENTLPKCTMVVPKNGLYQPDPDLPITETCSTVWVDIMNSPACGFVTSVSNKLDTVSSVTSIVGIGLCAASFFTPAAPVAIGAVAISSVTGVWSTGRSVTSLWDKISHEESVSPMERDALGLWLALGGGVFGLASSGGSCYITKLTQKGATMNNVAKIAYNSLVAGSLGINFIGVGYQAICMYEKYKEGKQISPLDVANLAGHILFFGNAVVKLQFAGDLIEATQGKILNDYKATLQSKNQRKQFNRVKRNAATNNTDKISENAEVIRFINRKAELKIDFNSGPISALKNNVQFQNGKIMIGSITLLDPMKFVDILINFDKKNSNGQYFNKNNSSGGLRNRESERLLAKLKDLLYVLLEKLYSKNDKPMYSSSIIDKFDPTFNDMKFMEHGVNIFLLVFEVSITLINLCFGSEFLPTQLEKSVHFIWSYVKESTRAACSETFSIFDAAVQKQIDEIILQLFNHMKETATQLKSAFEKYMAHYDMM